eukprot:CAMPEP_0169313198 /NCGR_PEP_ID=MMETSP1017-20121227/4453_1 /TAXON_ID=342587 /ORGANISM="Karlodinium micrum, Strain CCMP2283" /LENGTH=225 /DNA_ID=CAMNT_0009407047 /DNA_START=68 /DNA_END=742 /DNA_ORIENTATION=+
MPHIGLLFEIRCAETKPGEVISIVGGLEELGTWDPYDCKSGAARQLKTGPQRYPSWAMPMPVWVELDEDAPSNHTQDEHFDEESEPPSTPGSPTQSTTQRELDSCEESCDGELRGGPVKIDKTFVKVEYKYVKDRRQFSGGPTMQWEDCIANRSVTLPCEHGSMWIISDTRFNDSTEAPRLKRTSLAEVLEHRGGLDPEWTSHQKVSPSPEWTGRDNEDISSPGS